MINKVFLYRMFFVLVSFRILDFVISLIGLTFFGLNVVESNVFGFSLGLHVYNIIVLVIFGLFIFLINNDLIVMKFVVFPALLFLVFFFAFVFINNVAVILN